MQTSSCPYPICVVVQSCTVYGDTTVVTSCDSTVWNGITYTVTGIYTDTLVSNLNCDSIAILDFTVASPSVDLGSDTIHFNSIPNYWMTGVWVALEDVDKNNGALKIIPKSHKWEWADLLGRTLSKDIILRFYHSMPESIKSSMFKRESDTAALYPIPGQISNEYIQYEKVNVLKFEKIWSKFIIF